MTDGPRTAPTKHRRNCLEKIEELGRAEAGLAQYSAKRSEREIAPINGHDCLGAGIIPVPQETMRPWF
jgi:hypothetical protein